MFRESLWSLSGQGIGWLMFVRKSEKSGRLMALASGDQILPLNQRTMACRILAVQTWCPDCASRARALCESPLGGSGHASILAPGKRRANGSRPFHSLVGLGTKHLAQDFPGLPTPAVR